MMGRSGPFWDGVEGRAPIPPAAATLGFEFIDADVEAGTIEGRAPRRRPGVSGGVAARRLRGGRRHRHRDRPGDPAAPGTGRGLMPADPTKER
jgi:hypothetical protein